MRRKRHMNEPSIDPKLPRQISALLELGLDDLEAVNQDPRYHADAHEWHSPMARTHPQTRPAAQPCANSPHRVPDETVCAVCQAGAVIARTFGVQPETYASPLHLPIAEQDRIALWALDDIRRGQILSAMESLKIRGVSPQEFMVRGTMLEKKYRELHQGNDTDDEYPGQFFGKSQTVEYIAKMRELVDEMRKLGL